jgi:hypothetical protein
MASALERRFDLVWRAIGGPDLTREHRFHIDRRWRFDRAWLGEKIAFEIEGGTWSGGRHTRGAGYILDCEKYNVAESLGWHVFRVTGEMVSIAYLSALLKAMRSHAGIDFRFARKGGRARRFKPTPKGRLLKCNSLRRSGGAPSSSSP